MASCAPFPWLTAALALALAAAPGTSRADDLSASDRLGMLYSNRFSFSDRGLPLVTIEIMSGQSQVQLGDPGGVHLLPSGSGGAVIEAGTTWTIEAEQVRPAKLVEWTVVERFGHERADQADAAEARWAKRGYRTRLFELGTVFGVEGEVIDSRELLVAIDPVPAGKGADRARALSGTWKLETSLHPELLERPHATLVARSNQGAVVRHDDILWFAPRDDRGTIQVDNVRHGHGGSQLGGEGREARRYWGQVYVTLDNDGTLVVANAVEADALLSGLVPAEIFPEGHVEALRAQAIAARTEVLSRIGTRHVTDPYLLCSNQHCQVYAGAGHEHPRTTRAVRDTRGQVLLRPDGGLVDARYSASCGGHGEHNEVIWGGAPDSTLRGTLDATSPGALAPFSRITDSNIEAFLSTSPDAAYCGSTRYARGRFRWNTTVDAGQLAAQVAAAHGNIGAIVAIEPLRRSASGRIERLRLRGTSGEAIATGDLPIRLLLGGLKSSLFVVEAVGPRGRPTAFRFRGAGFGHGVGMCQTGAIGRAESGQSHDVILNHYYPGSRTHRLY